MQTWRENLGESALFFVAGLVIFGVCNTIPPVAGGWTRPDIVLLNLLALTATGTVDLLYLSFRTRRTIDLRLPDPEIQVCLGEPDALASAGKMINGAQEVAAVWSGFSGDPAGQEHLLRGLGRIPVIRYVDVPKVGRKALLEHVERAATLCQFVDTSPKAGEYQLRLVPSVEASGLRVSSDEGVTAALYAWRDRTNKEMSVWVSGTRTHLVRCVNHLFDQLAELPHADVVGTGEERKQLIESFCQKHAPSHPALSGA